MGCSYGINSYLLRHEVTLDEIYEHYRRHSAFRERPELLKKAAAEFLSRLQPRRGALVELRATAARS